VATRKARASLPAFPWGSLIRRQGLYQSVCAHRRVPAVGATAFPLTSRERKRAERQHARPELSMPNPSTPKTNRPTNSTPSPMLVPIPRFPPGASCGRAYRIPPSKPQADSSTRNPKGTPSEGQLVPVSRAHWQAQPGGRSAASVQGAAATMAAATVRRNGTGCPERSSYHTDTRTPAPRNGIGTLTARSFRHPVAPGHPHRIPLST
jgi:hypothetical protein